MTGTELPPSPTPPPSTTSCTGSCVVYAGIIKLEYITHWMPKLTILQLVFIGLEFEGEKDLPGARSLSLINEQEMLLEEMVEQPNSVCRELTLASVADRCECRSVWNYPPSHLDNE